MSELQNDEAFTAASKTFASPYLVDFIDFDGVVFQESLLDRRVVLLDVFTRQLRCVELDLCNTKLFIHILVLFSLQGEIV